MKNLKTRNKKGGQVKSWADYSDIGQGFIELHCLPSTMEDKLMNECNLIKLGQEVTEKYFSGSVENAWDQIVLHAYLPTGQDKIGLLYKVKFN